MNLPLDPEVQKLIDERVKSGRYATPEDVVAAALLTLDQQEWLGEVVPGELDQLLAEGEQSIAQDGTLDGNEAFQLRRARRAGKQIPSPIAYLGARTPILRRFVTILPKITPMPPNASTSVSMALSSC
jgi:Arc/MetJ-type ribon-helix-helix transcriptional regulator